MAYCYNFPKIKAVSINDQAWKIVEEAHEVKVEAVYLYLAKEHGEPMDFKALVVETLDSIQSDETLLQFLVDEGFVTQGFIDNAKAEVIHKNRERGYYADGSD